MEDQIVELERLKLEAAEREVPSPFIIYVFYNNQRIDDRWF